MVKRIFIAIVLVAVHASLVANIRSFEGNINFVRESVFDTTYITILVKGHLVRIDETDRYQRLVSSQIIDLKEDKVIALSHNQKLYAQIAVTPQRAMGKNNLQVRKTGNHKDINGVTCYQWRVKDLQRNTEIAYWVMEERFDFFESLLQLLNRTEYSFALFKDIPGSQGYFPMLTEERTLLRKDKLRIAVVDISEKNLSKNLFEIPSDYKSVRR